MESNDTNTLGRLSQDLADAVERAGAGTVTVNGRQRMPATGIVWSNDGLIVTANHVVERDTDLSVGLPDGRTVDATLIGRDPGSDIAILKIDAPDLAPAARSDQPVKPGNLVLAIGRPGPSGPMASFGVVSVVGGPSRRQRGGSIDGFIRADVAMLPGFSGGPLVNAEGNIVGLNSSHIGRGGGMTIPNAVIDAVAASLREHGKVRRGFLGIGAQSANLSPALAQAAGIEQEQGLIVVSVEPDGPADGAGIFQGDVIVAVAGTPVATVEDLQDRLTGELVGTTVPVTVIRGGNLSDINVIVAERGQ